MVKWSGPSRAESSASSASSSRSGWRTASRKAWNRVRYGSPAGPVIIIDWDRRTVQLQRFPPRLALKVMKWTRFSGGRWEAVRRD